MTRRRHIKATLSANVRDARFYSPNDPIVSLGSNFIAHVERDTNELGIYTLSVCPRDESDVAPGFEIDFTPAEMMKLGQLTAFALAKR